VYGFQQLSAGYFPTREKTQHVTSGTLSVEADCGRKLERNNFPSQRYCCALIFLNLHCLAMWLRCVPLEQLRNQVKLQNQSSVACINIP